MNALILLTGQPLEADCVQKLHRVSDGVHHLFNNCFLSASIRVLTPIAGTL